MYLNKRRADGQCSDCMFYYDEETFVTTGCGECRYGPPTAMPIFNKHDEYHMGQFPVVSEYDWCWRFIKNI